MAQNTESKEHKARRMVAILDILEKEYPGDFEGLDYTTPLELLVATMLSAQCTDARVNQITPALFAKYQQPQDYLNVPVEELEQDIRSAGYYKAKAKNIRGSCAMLIEKFGGQMPSTREELVQLPGVGRKTANCVLMHCYGQQAVTVDTHVTRLCNLLGFTQTTDAVKIEMELMEFVPEERWNDINRLLITHGRKVCIARRPQCSSCKIVSLCPSAGIGK